MFISEPRTRLGFTLVELSIVLVIIALLVGGVLVGKDLIEAAQVRAQVSQIEKFHTATKTFRLKYGYLPGDITTDAAAAYGFVARTGDRGRGDGNGYIEGYCCNSTFSPQDPSAGETGIFWNDLSRANLVDGSFVIDTVINANPPANWMDKIFPKGKLGGGANYVTLLTDGKFNYFVLSGLANIGNQYPSANTLLTPNQSFAIDTKLDDGLPQTGTVIAKYYGYTSGGWNWAAHWAGVQTVAPASNGSGSVGANINVAASGSALTCYENAGANTVSHYSTGQNGGTGLNCALSFRFQ